MAKYAYGGRGKTTSPGILLKQADVLMKIFQKLREEESAAGRLDNSMKKRNTSKMSKIGQDGREASGSFNDFSSPYLRLT